VVVHTGSFPHNCTQRCEHWRQPEYIPIPPQELSKQIEGHTICALGDAAAGPVQVLSKDVGGESPQFNRSVVVVPLSCLFGDLGDSMEEMYTPMLPL